MMPLNVSLQIEQRAEILSSFWPVNHRLFISRQMIQEFDKNVKVLLLHNVIDYDFAQFKLIWPVNDFTC